MTTEEIKTEMEKCKASPYYFATTYLKIKGADGISRPFTTMLSEEEFNKQCQFCNHGWFRTTKNYKSVYKCYNCGEIRKAGNDT